DVVTGIVGTTFGFETVSGGTGESSAPTRSGTASAKLATASHAPATTARRNLGIAHTYHARRRRHSTTSSPAKSLPDARVRFAMDNEKALLRGPWAARLRSPHLRWSVTSSAAARPRRSGGPPG